MEQNITSSKQITMNITSKFEFLALPYSYDALEPFIDQLTLEIHHEKQHKAYYDNFTKCNERYGDRIYEY